MKKLMAVRCNIKVSKAVFPECVNEKIQSLPNKLPVLIHALSSPVIYIALLGILFSYIFNLRYPQVLEKYSFKSNILYRVLENKYYFDDLYENVFAKLTRKLGNKLWQVGDVRIIDDWIVNGTAYRIGKIANKIKIIQSGYIYHYALMMIMGLAIFLAWTILSTGPTS